MPLSLTPLSELLGVEVSGVDCRTPPDAALRTNILTALHTHQVLVFRKQRLSKDELIAFSEAFGELEMHVNQADGGYERPNFHIVTNLDKDGNILPPPEPGREITILRPGIQTSPICRSLRWRRSCMALR